MEEKHKKMSSENLLIQYCSISALCSIFVSAATVVVVNYIVCALGTGKHCADLFTDLPKASDPVHPRLLLDELASLGFDGTSFKCYTTINFSNSPISVIY